MSKKEWKIYVGVYLCSTSAINSGQCLIWNLYVILKGSSTLLSFLGPEVNYTEYILVLRTLEKCFDHANWHKIFPISCKAFQKTKQNLKQVTKSLFTVVSLGLNTPLSLQNLFFPVPLIHPTSHNYLQWDYICLIKTFFGYNPK